MQPSIAERFFFGRQYDPVTGATLLPVVPRSGFALLGRILIAGIFAISGFMKLTHPESVAGYMTQAGIGHADKLVYVVGACEVAGALALIFGFLTRFASLCLIVLLCLISYFMHNFWTLTDAAARMQQQAHFFKNVGIMGGLFMVLAMGPGRYSIDSLMRRPRSP